MVDVLIHAYGKPWQTLCTLKSLMLHCGQHIDKIYLTIEAEQPFGEEVGWIAQYFTNVVVLRPKEYHRFIVHDQRRYITNDYRQSIRYQFGLEMSDKKHVFICHNDVLFLTDIIGDMLDKIGKAVGIGIVGMCWNCPCFKGGFCSPEHIYNYKPNYYQVVEIVEKFGTVRRFDIDFNQPMPLPECTLGNMAELIDRETTIMENYNGTPFFGTNTNENSGAWFRSMFLKGYKFINYDITDKFIHAYWAEIEGHEASINNQYLYAKGEQKAKEYFYANYTKKD